MIASPNYISQAICTIIISAHAANTTAENNQQKREIESYINLPFIISIVLSIEVIRRINYLTISFCNFLQLFDLCLTRIGLR